MKKRSFALAAAFVLTLVLTGCSADREGNTVKPDHGVSGSDNDARSSAGMFDAADGNDAFQGGGAGGTNDQNNDGLPDGIADSDDRNGVGRAADDIGRAADDLARDAGDAVRDAGDAIGDAADGIDRTMR